ncbi:hypothetical protein N658DRAFT_499191 [Parathielavia hyrcaniae]|uniref:Uncharacterized protein n=1 Tax=Parathielavia hyrcaniae TaxID=113614 RepID=A0AAN6PVU9_9PEZI|nr:hypothetical protein N658DRAFT_499191 [Parathielavia hyrcaniae]
MAPAPKRPSLSSHTEGMEERADSSPNNSITVAAGVPKSAGSETESAGSSPATGSPAVMAQAADEVGGPARPSSSSPGVVRDNRAGREGSSNGQVMPPPLATRPASRVPGAAAAVAAPGARDYYREYEYSDLDEITMRQLNEDVLAYRYDLDYCQAQLEEADLTPQETRTLQLRTLDLNHQIRHCNHRIETIKAQSRKHGFRPLQGMIPTAPYAPNGSNGSGKQHRTVSGGYGIAMPSSRHVAATPALATKKRLGPEEYGGGGSGGGGGGGAKRVKMATSPDVEMIPGLDEGVNTSLQRLGFWKCRLCSAPKYLLAGAGRSPAAPCKWPLKDISKMITHFTEMHGEHGAAERCVELGAALAQNRGPFEYWLRRTRAQNISDGSIIDDCFETLLNGEMPELLRRHSRAAAGMPVS